ncbi:TRAP transporter small permease [Pseudorhodobacter sp.]|uniref:TRAP transporter small permease n=1 Tax=Pseudorhodobacter sp. TaxID=1934400 RepID=UPI002647340C|nr:TRAP transporter small permease [Pseudorhodobacter sp.]MDN5785630.1 TRAP transporter small permease [Pseudorhodobacter sp.]
MAAIAILRTLERVVLVGLFLTMVALFTFGVIAREVGGSFASQFAWIEEAVRLMNVALMFFGLGLALERRRHVSIDTLRVKLPPPIRKALQRMTDASGLAFSLYLAWQGVGLVRFVLTTGQRSPTLDILMGWVYLTPVIGFLLLALRFGLSLFGAFDRFSAPGAGVQA